MRIILWVAALSAALETWAAPAWIDTLAADTRRAERLAEQLVSLPAHASARDWMIAGALAGTVVAVSFMDGDTRDEVRTWDEPWMKSMDDVGHTFQDPLVFFGTAGLVYVGGIAVNRPAWRRVGTELVVAFAVAQAGTQTIKYLAGRARPFTEDGPRHFVGPTTDDSYHSFWSGDVTTAFALASVLSAEVKQPVVTVLLYGLAATTAFQRIHTDKHWLSDVGAAAIWSTAVGIGTVKIGKHLYATPLGMAVSW